MLSAPERETVVTVTDDDRFVRIWTCQRKFIGLLHKHPSFQCTKAGNIDGTPWAEFEIEADQWSPVTGAKRRSNMTAEQRATAAARLKAARQSSQS